jgi:hypothetical protein
MNIYQRPLDRYLHAKIQEHNLEIGLTRIIQWHL